MTPHNVDYLLTDGKVCLLSKKWSPPVIVENLNLTLQREWFSMIKCLTSSSSEKGFLFACHNICGMCFCHSSTLSCVHSLIQYFTEPSNHNRETVNAVHREVNQT
ncbi:hypothetical protein F7725_013453 [Dissostichus mawsoni]|uniref:Uncharacterized protein n=1 Tax=Dissostichus mawsoni TaxID=36200 RepID=A0A7J5YRY2_DISMA|nr:hypothetical protein F7725_013453 [Dissostichus mawsoni]